MLSSLSVSVSLVSLCVDIVCLAVKSAVTALSCSLFKPRYLIFLICPVLLRGKMELRCRAHLWDGTVGACVSIFVVSYPFLPILHLFFRCTLWFNIVLLPNFPLLLIVNSWQGLLGELILLQQQIQEHEEEARRAAGQYSTSYAQQKRKVMDGLRGLLIRHTNQPFLPRSCCLNRLMGSSHEKLFLTNWITKIHHTP